jgi:carbon-monoxide dehydrogenase iron sulfur subunit
MKKIIPKEEYCIGCQLCEVYCALEHSRSKNIHKFKNEYPLPKNRVKVEINGKTSFALSCRHCEDAPCVDACISGAMQKDPETGIVINNHDKCVGCWMCIMSCPFGAIRKGDDEKVSLKCDFCPDLNEPACVANCPQEALIVVKKESK